MESASMIRKPEAPARNWLELPGEVIFMILQKLGAVEILTTAQNVCSLWYKICKDPFLWGVIHMHNSGDWESFDHLEIMCKQAVDRSCGQLVEISIEHFGSDELLLYITNSSKQVKRLRLLGYHHFTKEGLSVAVSNLPLFEHLEIQSFLIALDPETLRTIGRSCPLLKSLKLKGPCYKVFFSSSDEDALAIAETMHNLHHLKIVGNSITNFGLHALLDSCSDLQSLDLCECIYLDLDEHFASAMRICY